MANKISSSKTTLETLNTKLDKLLLISSRHDEKLNNHTEKLNKIDAKMDTAIRALNDHDLRQGIKLEKLEKIHPNYTHSPLVA